MPQRILIAEDNDRFAALLETLLRRQGHETRRVKEGEGALRSLLASPPDLLLLDLRLPDLHGIEVLKRLRRNGATRSLPVIISTGVYRGERFAEAARKLGVRHYLEKPYPAAALLGAVRQCLDARERGTGLDRLLHRALLSRFSGEWRLHTGEGEHALGVFNGQPVSLRPGFVHADFGAFLLARGVITEGEYGYYREGAQGRCDALVQMGCLEYPQLLQERLSYLTAELVAGFGRPLLEVEERPCGVSPRLQPVTVNVPSLLYHGYHACDPGAEGSRLLRHFGGRYVAAGAQYYRFINFLPLAPEERRLAARLDGTRTLSGCLEEGGETLIPALRTFHRLGMLRFSEAPCTPAAVDFPLRRQFNAPAEDDPVPASPEELERFTDLVQEAQGGGDPAALESSPPADDTRIAAGSASLAATVRETHSKLQNRNDYEIFGMTQAAFSFDRLRERYFALTRRFGPDLMMQLGGEEAAMGQEILSRVSTAYNTLSDVVKKERYDELLGSERIGLGHKGDERFRARVQFQSGKVFLDMREWDSAEQALQDACNIDPSNGDYLAHLAWAIYCNPKNANSRALQKKARQMLNRALVLDRTAAGFAFKGRMLLDGGQDALAESEFNKALKLDARLRVARAGLRQIQAKREEQKKGLFRRIFR